jgi:hypothetical protein
MVYATIIIKKSRVLAKSQAMESKESNVGGRILSFSRSSDGV